MDDNERSIQYCVHCKTNKEVSHFDPSTIKDGLKQVCRVCCRAISKQAKIGQRQQTELNAKGRNYSSRNANLRRLGFANYREYLSSELWKQVRAAVYKIKGRVCYLCGNAATELHHNRYHTNDLIGKRLCYIKPICRGCHQGIEFREGEKATLKQAARGFNKQRKHRNRTHPQL